MVAQELIDFDKQWSSIMATQGDDAKEVEEFYTKTFEFPPGL